MRTGPNLFVALAALGVFSWPAPTRGGESVWLSSLDLGKMTAGWGKPQVDKSTTQKTLSIGGKKYEHGVGTHARSVMYVDLRGGVERFVAEVGVDDAAKPPVPQEGTVVFRVFADGKELFNSRVMRRGDAAKKVDVPLAGAKTLLLMAAPAANTIHHDHADWAEARFELAGTARPRAIDPPREEAVILTPKPPHEPRINGAKVFGVRPGRPFLFTIPATGDRPMQFSADGLPEGLKLDPATGQITGCVAQRGEYVATLRARNALGTAERKFRIAVGDRLMLTPSMGWNSWYCFLNRVTEKDMRGAADAMVATGMINHGYSYVDVDDCWMVNPDDKGAELGGPPRDPQGRLVPNKRFGDMKALADYIHSKGLKAGLYISPGPRTCAGFEGSYGHEAQDAQTFAQWGFDLLKYDWCSYGQVAEKLPGSALEKLQHPYRVMSAALAKQDRDIVLNLCQYGMGNVWEWGAEVGGQSWRTTDDLGLPGDLAGAMYAIGFSQNGKEKWAGPGHWNDPDYLLVGWITWNGRMSPTPLAPNEQYTHVTLWSILAAPLIFSGDMTRLDEFTLSLLTNDEVLEVNQDPLGRQARRVAQDGDLEVWAKDMEDGSKAVGLFNRGEIDSPVTVRWPDLGLQGRQVVRDLWRQKDSGEFAGRFTMSVPRHGAALVRLTPAK